MKNTKISYIVTSAFIAAVYAGLTYFCGIFGLAYGPIQLRLSEVLTVLPIFTPAAIPGLTIGCLIANIASFNVLDMIFGTLATLIAALLCRAFGSIRFKGLPLLSILPSVVVNAVVIGFEISWFYLPAGLSLWGFLVSGLEVGIGEFIVCYIFGIPFYLAIEKHNIFKSKVKR